MRWPVTLVPDTWAEQLTACEWLCYISPTLRKLGVDGLRKALRKYFDHRWTPNDVLYALDRNATGELYTDNTPAGNESAQAVGRWLDRRLRQWEDGDGIPLVPLGDHITAQREQKLADQAVARITWEERAAAAASPATNPDAATARQIARDAAVRARRVHATASARELAARRAELNAEDHRRDTLLALEKHITTAAAA